MLFSVYVSLLSHHIGINWAQSPAAVPSTSCQLGPLNERCGTEIVAALGRSKRNAYLLHARLGSRH